MQNTRNINEVPRTVPTNTLTTAYIYHIHPYKKQIHSIPNPHCKKKQNSLNLQESEIPFCPLRDESVNNH